MHSPPKGVFLFFLEEKHLTKIILKMIIFLEDCFENFVKNIELT